MKRKQEFGTIERTHIMSICRGVFEGQNTSRLMFQAMKDVHEIVEYFSYFDPSRNTEWLYQYRSLYTCYLKKQTLTIQSKQALYALLIILRRTGIVMDRNILIKYLIPKLLKYDKSKFEVRTQINNRILKPLEKYLDTGASTIQAFLSHG